MAGSSVLEGGGKKIFSEIENRFEIIDLFESDNYRLVGLPFYNEVMKKQEFTDEFKKTDYAL